MKIKSFEMDPSVPLERAVVDVCLAELGRAQNALRERPDGDEEAVHEYRKSMKKLRSLIRLVRPELGSKYDTLNEGFRDAARMLSDARDRTVMVETAEALEKAAKSKKEKAAAGELARAVRRRISSHQGGDVPEDRIAAALDLAAGAGVHLHNVDVSSTKTAARGFEKVYRKARKRYDKALDGGDEALHDLRKSIKHHRYHLRFLRPTYREVLSAERDVAKEASSLLGDDHDLVVIGGKLRDLEISKKSRPILRRLVSRRRKAIRRRALRLAGLLLQEKPKERRKRMMGYLKRAKKEHG